MFVAVVIRNDNPAEPEYSVIDNSIAGAVKAAKEWLEGEDCEIHECGILTGTLDTRITPLSKEVQYRAELIK